MGEIRENTTRKKRKGAFMKATGVVRRIDDLGRIVIPKEIRKNLKIRDGESLEIFVDNEEITLKKFSSSKDLSTISQALLDTVYTTVRRNVFVTDRDVFIAGSGDLKKDFLGKELSEQIIELLLSHEKVVKNNVNIQSIIATPIQKNEKYNYIMQPILVDGETIGLVLMIEIADNIDLDTDDEKISLIIAQFLEKYLEQ